MQMSLHNEAKSRREGQAVQGMIGVQGYNQAYGINYDETFILVAKMSTVKTLISLVVNDE
jgi:hypothetical protein